MDPQHFDPFGISSHGALLFGDDCDGTEAALAAIEDAGLSCRIVDRVESAHLALQGPFANLLVLETATASEDEIADLLARIIPYAQETGVPVIATAPNDKIDLLWSYLSPLGAQLLCQPSAHDRRAAIETALARPMCATLQDSSAARSRELDSLRDDIERVGRSVRSLAGEPQDGSPFLESSTDRPVSAAEVRQEIRTRRLRDRFFDSRLFADPAWDILLDLYAAHLEHREVSVSSLCIAAATPPTTALRWIGSMTDAGILERRPDSHDKRRHLIALSASALHAIERYFIALHASRST